jgi:hypothetical protein
LAAKWNKGLMNKRPKHKRKEKKLGVIKRFSKNNNCANKRLHPTAQSAARFATGTLGGG